MLTVFNTLFPVLALIAMGAILRRTGFTSRSFLQTADRLVYFILFPALLFWKIAAAPPGQDGISAFLLAAISAVLTVYLLSTLFIVFGPVPRRCAGSFSQSCYRFNTYIGMAVVLYAMGERGVEQFSIIIGFTIPLINVLAVSTLIWFSDTQYKRSEKRRLLLRAVASNPLILGCLSGLIYQHLPLPLPACIQNTLRLATMATLPLALLSIGGSLTMAGAKTHLPLATAAAGFKLLLLPALGWIYLSAFGADALAFKTGMIFFTLPTSTALYVLSAQLGSSTGLASAAIVVSTILSILPLSLALMM